MSDNAQIDTVAALAGRQGNPFNPRAVLAIALVGFIAFLLAAYFMAIGDTGDDANNGNAHAASNGLTGYSALVDLLARERFDARTSRSQSGLQTDDLLVLTPPASTDPEEFAGLLEERQYQGPTIVILPKWQTAPIPRSLDAELAEKVKPGWVQLSGSTTPVWTSELPEPYRLDLANEQLRGDGVADFIGYGESGKMPTGNTNYAKAKGTNETLIKDGSGNALAVSVLGDQSNELYYEVIFVADPDLLNNYGMADERRAIGAVELFDAISYENDPAVVFDLTLNGIGNSTNLLTLAFTPPFLAATLCLIVVMLLVGWRAFKRFGPSVAQRPAIAFGKKQLVSNGAGLIVRAKKFGLLAEPYIDMSAQRCRDALGLTSRDEDALDAAIERRLPDQPNFTQRAGAMRTASSQAEILRAAQALKDLERTLKQ